MSIRRTSLSDRYSSKQVYLAEPRDIPVRVLPSDFSAVVRIHCETRLASFLFQDVTL